jgi:hypothetical protein
MKIVSDALAAIAANLNLDYLRSTNKTEADVYIHNLKTSSEAILIYNGASDITTEFEGAMIIDTFDSHILIMTKKTKPELSGAQLDELLEITKRFTDKMYAALNLITAKDIKPYKAEAHQLFTDAYVGHEITMGIPFFNEGC